MSETLYIYIYKYIFINRLKISRRNFFVLIWKKNVMNLQDWNPNISGFVDEIRVQVIAETTQRIIIHRNSITLHLPPKISVWNSQILRKFFTKMYWGKKIPFKFGKKTAYSSLSWPNSPEYIGYETLHQI